jgi:outer membrane protein, multidrug efflux system
MKRGAIHIVVPLAAALTSSCALYRPEPREPAAGMNLPGQFRLYEAGQAVPAAWWATFGTEELDRLVAEALASNLDLVQARARLEQAEALARKSGAAQRPSANIESGVAVTERGEPVMTDGDTRSESYELTLAASYEVDLWGRVAATARAAETERDATAADLLAARLSVSAEIALRYLELLAVRSKLDILQQQLDTNRRQLTLLEGRYGRGQATGVAVLRQRMAVKEALSLLPSQAMREEQLLNQLATLSGRPAGSAPMLTGRALPNLPPHPETGLPADLLAQRPDIRAAGLRLNAADWTLSAARADRLPALRLGASGGWSSDALADLLDDWLARLAGSLVGPIVDAGLRKAEVARTRAIADQRLAAYRETVLEAMREVQDALAGERHEGARLAASTDQLSATRRLAEDLERRYLKGMESYVDVLDAVANVQRLERQLVDVRVSQIGYRVRLHRALGGDLE